MDRPRILIVYGTSYGQTAKIAKAIGEDLTDRGCIVDVRFGKHFTIDWPLEHYDGLIVGASVYMQRHQPYIVEFARAYEPFIEGIPTAFFSVSGTAGDESAEARREARKLVERFIDRTGWVPDMTASFAGSIPYTKYGALTRYLMQFISRLTGASTDTTRDHEYTDWDRVAEFAEDYFEELGAEVAPAPAPEERAAARRVGGHPRPPK